VQGEAVDHYVVLGVAKTATMDEIKKAHRKLVRTAHPDAGGDAETFGKIQRAYETLIDPERRERYDKGEPGPETIIHAAQMYVSSIVVALFKVGDASLLTFNVIEGMQEMCEKDQQETDKNIADAQKKMDLMEKVKAKMTHNADGERPDVIGTTINREINLLSVEIKKQEFRKSLLKLAHFIISDYGYTPDEKQEERREPNMSFSFGGRGFRDFSDFSKAWG